MMLVLLTLVSHLVLVTWGYSTGPPVSTVASVCEQMNPGVNGGHGVPAQVSAAPFEILTGGCYKPGQEITVRTKATSNKEIEGIFIQARKQTGTNTKVAVGEFRVKDSVLSALTCNNKAKSAAGHNQEKGAYERVVYWTPPADLTEEIKFTATIVAEKVEYWTFVKSTSLKLDLTCSAAPPMAGLRSTLTALPVILIAFFTF